MIENCESNEIKWIDDSFYMKKTRMGLWKSVLKDNKDFLFGLEYSGVLSMTRWHLKCLQEGTLNEYSKIINSGVVDGKL